MNKIESSVKNSRYSSKVTKYTLYIIIIISAGLIARFSFFPYDVPLSADALYYFWYSSDIYQIGGLPNDWSPGNNGWPLFVGTIFSIVDSKDIFSLMQTQRILSLVISMGIPIPVYFLCKKFVARKFALIGAAVISFDPRLMVNSLLGITDPLFLLLSASSIAVFVHSNKKTVYLAFVFAALATLVRSEGLAIFFVLSIMFFIKFREERYRIIFRYFIIVIIFGLILLPASLYRIDVTGNDYLVQRGITHAEKITSNIASENNQNVNISAGFELFVKYLVWILIPNFIVFVPFGIYLLIKKINVDKLTIILSLVILSLPALYGYTLSALDTRYLYVLFPMFTVLSVLAIERFSSRLSKQNLFVLAIISSIIISSIIVYDYLKVDYEHEKEAFEIMKDVSSFSNGINEFSSESRYISTIYTINQWPTTYKNLDFKTIVIKIEENDSLLEFIHNSKEKGLTHIVTDDKDKRPEFIQRIFAEEEDYRFLEKVYDSKTNDDFNYHVKVFKINYELLN